MKKDNIESVYELSPVQQGMLFHSLYAPSSGVYVVQECIRLRGKLEVASFERAWQQVVDRHPTLRTSFHWRELEKPVQVVFRQLPVTVERGSWRGLEEAEQERRLDRYLEDDRERGFDLETAPLMRLALFELGGDRYQLVWSLHHIYADGCNLFASFDCDVSGDCDLQSASNLDSNAGIYRGSWGDGVAHGITYLHTNPRAAISTGRPSA